MSDEITDKDLASAADLAYVSEFLDALPQGIDVCWRWWCNVVRRSAAGWLLQFDELMFACLTSVVLSTACCDCSSRDSA